MDSYTLLFYYSVNSIYVIFGKREYLCVYI